MTLRAKVKYFVRNWIGLWMIRDEVHQIESFVIANEERQRLRHCELLEAMIQLVNGLSALNKRMINEHIGQPREFTAQVLDWDAVQAIALAELERNTQKEN